MKSTITKLYTTLLLLFSGQLHSQTITVAPAVICGGKVATININYTPPQGKTVAKYIFDLYGNGNPATTISQPKTAPFYSYLYAPGIYTMKVSIKLSDSSSIGPVNKTITVYHLPIANFSLISQDKQCFRNNQFCFKNLSVKNPLTPSNPLNNYYWNFGDAAGVTSISDTMCHTFHSPSSSTAKYSILLSVVDVLGCFADTLITNLVTVYPNIAPDFKWTFLSGPCFNTCYLFQNTGPTSPTIISHFSWLFGDSAQYEGIGFNDPNHHFDTIQHCYKMDGQFSPGMILTDINGCIDSIFKTPWNSMQALPQNITPQFNIAVTNATNPTQQGIDSSCWGSSKGLVCFSANPISFAQGGSGDFVWNFGDSNNLNNNFDSSQWNVCHTYLKAGSYFPSLTLKNVCPDTTFYYYSTISTWSRLDSSLNRDNDWGLNPASGNKDLVKPFKFSTQITTTENIKLYNTHKQNVLPQLLEDGNTDATIVAFENKSKGLIVYFERAYPIVAIPGPNPVLKDSIEIPLGDILHFNRVLGGDKPLFHRVNSLTGKPDSLYAFQMDSIRPVFYFKKSLLITDTLGFVIKPQADIYFSLLNKLKLSGYGIQIIGPISSIENTVNGNFIASQQKSQCGPTDTVDFINTSSNFKSRKIWRRWDFDDQYAPQCTSFSYPKRGYPQNFVAAGKWGNGPWMNAIEQDLGSEHFFLLNGVMYPGNMPCKYSTDSLPRHAFTNWDTVYNWYRKGHDFMPWNISKWDTVFPPAAGKNYVQPSDKKWWGKPIYLNIENGRWSLVPGTSIMQHQIKNYLFTDPITNKTSIRYYVDTLPSAGSPSTISFAWPRIDTMNLQYNNSIDLTPGSTLAINNVPDPIGLSRGKYVVLNNAQIDTVGPTLQVKSQGDSWSISPTTTIPGGGNFYEYVFRKTVQRCLYVKLKLQDSSNNASYDATTKDSLVLDNLDCADEAITQLAFGKPDANGLGISGKFCPGLSANSFGANIRFNLSSIGSYPGITPSCGQSIIFFNYDSLADRKDKTPCTLDGFVGYAGGFTPGGIYRPQMFSGNDFNPLTAWTNPFNTSFVYHYGFNSGTPPPADTVNGWVTVGIQVGNGCKDTLRKDVLLSQYRANTKAYQSSIVIGNNTYVFNQVINFRTLTPSIPDTLIDIEYVDCSTPRCISTPVWYHHFLRIINLDPEFTVFPRQLPGEVWKLRGKGENITVFPEDSIQDSIKFDAWFWGDATATVDSFWYAGNDTLTNGFYTNGMRRVRYNFDLLHMDLDTIILIDSTVWPIHASYIGAKDGLKARTPGFFKKVTYDTISYCNGQLNSNPSYIIVDTAMMLLPITHKFLRTSWEADNRITPYKGPDANISPMVHQLSSTAGCQQFSFKFITIGIIDTFDTRNKDGYSDSIFCVNEPVIFFDSIRYWRWDSQVTSLPFFPDETNNRVQGNLIYGYPDNILQIDTFNFWRYWEYYPLDYSGFKYRDSVAKWNTYTNKLEYLRFEDSILAERVYWDFGDATYPLYMGRNPIHSYSYAGRFKVNMYSRDSLGFWDTCSRYVNIVAPEAKIGLAKSTFNCGVPAVSMWDSSYMANGNGVDSIQWQYWWFGDNKSDSINPFIPATGNPNPQYPYRTNGVFTIKLVVQTFEGCTDTTRRSIRIGGPRPYYKILSDTTGCAPLTVKIVNMADYQNKLNPSDTPTRKTIFDWGDGNSTVSTNRKDTLTYTYLNIGDYVIVAFGSDEDPITGITTCPVVVYPDTLLNNKEGRISVKDGAVGKISGPKTGYVEHTSDYSVTFQNGYLYTWTVSGGTIQTGNGSNTITVLWPSTPGTYTIIVKKQKTGSCITYDTLKVSVTLTGIKDLASIVHIDVFPNPASTVLNLSFESTKTKDIQFTLLNVLGQECLKEKMNHVTGKYSKGFLIDHLSEGIYFTVIETDEGKVVGRVLIRH